MCYGHTVCGIQIHNIKNYQASQLWIMSDVFIPISLICNLKDINSLLDVERTTKAMAPCTAGDATQGGTSADKYFR